MTGEPEPWDVAAGRGLHGLDLVALLLLAGASVVAAIVPPLRLVVHTILRLLIAGAIAGLSFLLPEALGRPAMWVAHAFAFLALFGIAAHIEGAVLGPIVNRITKEQ